MTITKLATCAAALVLFAAGSAQAQKGKPAAKCTDVPLKVEIVPIWQGDDPPVDVSVLSEDGKGAYIDGVAGVTTKIDFCGFSGATYDATVFLGNTKRSIGFTLPLPIPGSIIDAYGYGPAPTWANGATTVWSQPYFKVRDILYGRHNSSTSHTTRMVITRIENRSETDSYALNFTPLDTDALNDFPPNVEDANNPYTTSAVRVTEESRCVKTGDTWTGEDKWRVTIDPVSCSVATPCPPDDEVGPPWFIGTLKKDVVQPGPVHSGQYNAPFQLLFTAKTCVPSLPPSP